MARPLARLDSGWELVSPYDGSNHYSSPLHMGNPVDGDPDYVETASRYYRTVSEAIQRARDGLSAATNVQENISEAVWAFKAIAEDVQANINLIDERYSMLAERLAIYAPILRNTQQRCLHARDAAVRADQLKQRAIAQRDHYSEQLAHPEALPANAYAYSVAVSQAEDQIVWANADLARQKAAVVAAIAERSAAAQQAADSIDVIISHAELNDGAMDKVTHFFSETLMNWIEGLVSFLDQWGWVIDAIAILLMIVAFAAMLTGVGAALTVVLVGLTKALKVVQAISKVIKLAKLSATTVLFLFGRKSLGDLCAAWANFGIGKGISAAGKRLVGAARFEGWVYDRLLKGLNINCEGLTPDALKVLDAVPDVLSKSMISEVNLTANAAVNLTTGGSDSVPDQLTGGGNSWGRMAVDGLGLDGLDSVYIGGEPWDPAAFLDSVEKATVTFEFGYSSASTSPVGSPVILSGVS